MIQFSEAQVMIRDMVREFTKNESLRAIDGWTRTDSITICIKS